VHDCGQIINPNGVKAQIAGNVIQTVSPHAKGGSHLRPQHDHVPRLGKLSDSQIPGIAGDRNRADRQANRKAMGRRRANRCGHSLGDLERDFDATGARLRSVPFKREKAKAALRLV
jgi:hypothetical protein